MNKQETSNYVNSVYECINSLKETAIFIPKEDISSTDNKFYKKSVLEGELNGGSQDCLIINHKWHGAKTEDDFTKVLKEFLESDLSKLKTKFSDISFNIVESVRKVIRNNNHFHFRVYLPPSNSFESNIQVAREEEDTEDNIGFKNVVFLFNGFAECNIDTFDEIAIELAQKGTPTVFVPLPFHFVRNHKFLSKTDEQDDIFDLSENDLSIIQQQMFQSFYANPKIFNLIVYNHYKDVNLLISQLLNHNDGRCDLLSSLFNSNTKIHLIGHSLGGLFSLMQKCSDDYDYSKISKVICLESGASLDSVRANQLFYRGNSINLKLARNYFYPPEEKEKVDIDVFESFFNPQFEKEELDRFHRYVDYEITSSNNKIVMNLKVELYYDENLKSNYGNSKFQKLPVFDQQKVRQDALNDLLKRDINKSNLLWRNILTQIYEDSFIKNKFGDEFSKIYRQIIFSDHSIDRRNIFEKNAKDLLFILGGADDIFSLKTILDISPDSGLTILQIPSLTHFIQHRKTRKYWDYWKSFLINNIELFINHDGK